MDDLKNPVIERLNKTSSSIIETTHAEILSDVPTLRILERYFFKRSNTYKNCATFVRNLPRNAKVCVLLDCDVILSYIQPEETSQQNAMLARYFFEKSNLDYAIPVGAFEELMEKISDRIGLPSQPLTKREIQNPLHAVFSILGILNEELDDPQIVADLEKQTDDRILRLSRLLFVLEDESRFKGVYGNFMEEDRILAKSMIVAETRQPFEAHNDGSEGHREKRDGCDAKNLAVALYQFSNSENSTEHCVLMTLTGPVVRAGINLASRKHYSHGAWFVSIPIHILSAELLGIDQEQRVTTRDKFDSLYRELSSLAVNYSKQLDRVSTGNEKKSKTNELIKSTMLALNKARDNGFEKIETDRESIVSARIARTDLKAGEKESLGTHPRFTSFLRLLNKLRTRLHVLEGATYEVKPKKSPDPRRLDRYLIGNQRPSGQFDPFIELDVFKSGDELDLWSAQWFLDVNERRFFESIDDSSELLPTPLSQSVESVEFEIDPSISSEFWERGVIVSTCFKSFGIEIEHAVPNFDWNKLTIHQLRRLVARRTEGLKAPVSSFLDTPEHYGSGLAVAVRQQIREMPVFSFNEPIEEVRVNLPDVDLVFEIIPPEGEHNQKFTMMSSLPLYDAVAHFYDWLGIKLALKVELRKAIEKILSPYFE